jgi:HEPN domain-containing protein
MELLLETKDGNIHFPEVFYFHSLRRFFSCLSITPVGYLDMAPLYFDTKSDLVHIHATAQKDFERWWHQSNVFYNNALFNYQQKETKIAVFHLHQAAESAYQAILLSFTGYKPCTHNLDKLRRYTNRFSVKLASLFPRDTENEDHIFKLLLRGYIASRYDETYTIVETELTLLIERVKQLLTIAERICKNQFIHLEKQFITK